MSDPRDRSTGVGGARSATDGEPGGADRLGGDGTPNVESAITRVDDVPEPDGERRRLDPRVRVVWMLGAFTTTMIVTAIAAVVSIVFFDGTLAIPVATALFVGLAGVWLVGARYRRWSYTFRADSLLLDRGVVTQVRTVVPYVRIQHVDTRRGPVERALGLASVVVYTAGSRGADVSVPGLTRERAEELQRQLKHIAIESDGEDAV